LGKSVEQARRQPLGALERSRDAATAVALITCGGAANFSVNDV
jgi:hypothetical protein